MWGRRAAGVFSFAFSADGKLLATSASDGHVRIWDVAARKEGRRLRGLRGPKAVWGSLAFSPDGRRLAIGIGPVQGEFVPLAPRVFDVGSGKQLLSLDNAPVPSAVSFSPDGRIVATVGDRSSRGGAKEIQLWDATSGQEIGRLSGSADREWGPTFSPDVRFVATRTSEGDGRSRAVRLREVATGQEVACFNGHKSYVGALAFTPDGRTLATGGGDATILLWDLTGHAPDGRPRPERLSRAGLEQCWRNLGDDNAAAAYRAVWGLADDPARSVPFLRERLRPVPAAEPAVLARHLADLDANEFEVRQRAETDLTRLGDAAEPALRKVAAGASAPHVRKRAEGILDALVTSSERLRSRRAVAALEYAGTPEARRVLEGLAGGMPAARLTMEARAALGRLDAIPSNRP
jgi:hypothetical protein